MDASVQPGQLRVQGGTWTHRRARHYRFSGEIELDWNSTIVRGVVRDISSDGMFIEIADWPCMVVRFSARLALDNPLPLNCSVQRVVPKQGLGVTITFPNEEARCRFNALLIELQKDHDPGYVRSL